MKQMSIPTAISESAVEEAVRICGIECDECDIYISTLQFFDALRLMKSTREFTATDPSALRIRKVGEAFGYKDGEWLMLLRSNGTLMETVYNPPI